MGGDPGFVFSALLFEAMVATSVISFSSLLFEAVAVGGAFGVDAAGVFVGSAA